MSTHPNAPGSDAAPARVDGRRILPHDELAEVHVVGGVLLDAKAFHSVADVVSSTDFYHPVRAAIFQAMVDLDKQSKPIDQVTVAQHMQASGEHKKLQAQGGEKYLGELASAVVTVENITYHAGLVRTLAHNRRILEAASEVVSKGYGDGGKGEDFADTAGRLVLEATQLATRTTYESARKILGRTIKAIEQRYERQEIVTGVPAGFHKLDAMTCGFQPGDLVVVAARPSMGKTSLVMNAAQNAAIEHKMPVLVFSLEMSKESLMERLISAEARIDGYRLKSGFLEQRDWINFTKAQSLIAEAPIWIDDAGAPTLLEIRAKARRWRADQTIFKHDGQLGMVVVDYLQLVAGDRARASKEPNREREISEISRGLKALAKELKCPVVALSQLNRGVESRADKRPQLSDLRESGAIEQDADVIAFIYRDEVYNKDSQDRGVAEVIVGKQRTGAIGTVRLAFMNQYTRFENLAEGRDDDEPPPQPAQPAGRRRGGSRSAGYTREPQENDA